MKQKFFAPITVIQKKLDATGMYRTVTLALLFLVICSLLAGLFNLSPYTVPEQIISLFIICGVALCSNILLAFLFRVSANHESAIITGLIVFFLVLPAQMNELQYSLIGAAAIFFAVLSKYVIVWRKQHIINPAAAGTLAVMIIYSFVDLPPGYFETGWWIGQPVLFIPLLLAGATVVSKVRKWVPITSFVAVAYLVYVFEEWRFAGDLSMIAPGFFTSGPTLFLAFFMLTEPFTTPPRKEQQTAYGAVVGFLSQTTAFLPFIKMTPELALIVGNVLFYPFTLRQKLFLKLKEKREIAKDTFEYIFEKPFGFTFVPGQYLEWMLPHQKSDERGIRRYFTIASSPTEADVHLSLKHMPNGSSYKAALQTLDNGQPVIASQLAGDFVLPKDTTKKLGFIAGGIGVTPFRSHIKYMVDSGKAHDTVLYYCNKTQAEIAYNDTFRAAEQTFAFKVVHVLSDEQLTAPYEHGFITADMITRLTPDVLERHWYLSGPPGMVAAYAKLLKSMGVKEKNLTKDFFPGLA